MKYSYDCTMRACFTGYIVQAIVNNFVPLLFLTFQHTYHIPLQQITLLVTFNFGIQLLTDLLSVAFVDRMGYQASMVLAHILSALGLICLTVLPEWMGHPFAGILISVIVYAVGGGLLEVLVSPVVEACPSSHKEKAMSMLHSFYCWGHVGVVLFSSIFFKLAGIENWKLLAVLWAVIPILNALVFTRVPIAPVLPEGEEGMTIGTLFQNRTFWLLFVMMICAGASEQSVSQWASLFAEKGLGVTKTIGDLAGPMLFAILMGSSRAFYGKAGHRMDLDRFMLCSSVLCILSYLLIVFSPLPVFSLVGCGICGLSVGIMWPGTFSKASSALRRGGTAMFALLALAGDLGCSGGPTLVGAVASAASDNLKIGILVAIIFPVVMALGVCLCKKKKYPGLV